MKTIKFFAFAMLLTLTWAACKNNAAETTAETTATALDSVFTANKATAEMNVTALTEAVANKLAELEASLATADEATKANINTELETYKKFKFDLETVATRVKEATPETWATVNTEVEAVHYSVKSVLTGTGTSDKLSK